MAVPLSICRCLTKALRVSYGLDAVKVSKKLTNFPQHSIARCFTRSSDLGRRAIDENDDTDSKLSSHELAHALDKASIFRVLDKKLSKSEAKAILRDTKLLLELYPYINLDPETPQKYSFADFFGFKYKLCKLAFYSARCAQLEATADNLVHVAEELSAEVGDMLDHDRQTAITSYIKYLERSGGSPELLSLLEKAQLLLPSSLEHTVIYPTVLLIKYFSISADNIINEIKCLKSIRALDLIEEVEPLKCLKFQHPSDIAAYLGTFVAASKRKLRTPLTLGTFSELLHVSSSEMKDRISGEALSAVLRKYDGEVIQETFQYLLELGFPIELIGEVPMLLSYNKTDIQEALKSSNEFFQDKYSKTNDKLMKLNLLFVYLDRKNDFYMLSFPSPYGHSHIKSYKNA